MNRIHLNNLAKKKNFGEFIYYILILKWKNSESRYIPTPKNFLYEHGQFVKQPPKH